MQKKIKMVSRRKILNRSRDGLNIDLEEDDIWYQKEKLFKVSHFCFLQICYGNFKSFLNLQKTSHATKLFFRSSDGHSNPHWHCNDSKSKGLIADYRLQFLMQKTSRWNSKIFRCFLSSSSFSSQSTFVLSHASEHLNLFVAIFFGNIGEKQKTKHKKGQTHKQSEIYVEQVCKCFQSDK